jgi:hypothetical protein
MSIEEIKEWFSHWGARLRPLYVRILGGEPLLHPQLPKILEYARRYFQESTINLCSNGLVFDRHPNLPELLELYHISLWISVHARDEAYIAKMLSVEQTLIGWEQRYDITIGYGDNVYKWSRFYTGLGKDMRPFNDNNPELSYNVCHSNTCLNIVGGRLYKCPQIGNLHLITPKFDLQSIPEWQPYLAYSGLPMTASDDELKEFLSRKAEPICSMCPTFPEKYIPDIQNTNFSQPGVLRVPPIH